jgi:serine-type D-Ala-D-Ala carboxypeptidase/endopeptidase
MPAGPARWRLVRNTLAVALSAGALVVTSCVSAVPSAASPTVPSAPTGAYAVGGLTGATVSWTAPASSVTITGYEVVPYLGTTAKPGVRFSSLATTETVSLLTNFATYSFAVEALSTGGASPPSKQSNFVVINLQGELGKSINKFIAKEHVVGLAAAVVMPTPAKSSTPSAMDFLDGLSRVGGSAVTATTQFEIGSNTKTFTSALLSYMITQNKISLDDDLQAFTPTGTTVTSANGEQITIADLVTDEAGLPDDPANLAGDCTAPCTPLQNYTEALMWEALTDPIGLTPGANWQYSDFGNGVLGTVLANIYDPHQAAPPYDQALTNLVTGPLGMSSTYLEQPTSQLATGYKYLAGVQTRTKRWDNTGAMAGGGGLISDLDDMTTWVEAQSGFPNADSSFLPQTTSPLTDVTSQCTDDLCSPKTPFQMGMAWEIYPETGLGQVAIKTGGTPGMSSALVVLAGREEAAVILANEGGLASNGIIGLGVSLLQHLPPPTSAAPSPTPPTTRVTCSGDTCM